MLIDELRAILRDLAVQVGARSASVVCADDAPARQEQHAPSDHPTGARRLALGNGTVLVVELEHDSAGTAAAVERAARALRAAARRWDVDRIPTVRATDQATTSKDRILDRMRAFLGAFCGSTGAGCACVVRRGQLMASSSVLDELQESRLPFLARQAQATARKQVGTSHAVVFGDDTMAATFYYDAVLIAFLLEPVAPDFMRHHARAMCRELVHLVELFDDGPPEPAHVNPV